MARPGRSERNRTAQSFRELRRFHHVINSDEVVGTHRSMALNVCLLGECRLYVNLMPKDQDLGYQRGPRSEQYYQRRPDQAAIFSHKIETLRDSASLASRIRFPTGTDCWRSVGNLRTSAQNRKITLTCSLH